MTSMFWGLRMEPGKRYSTTVDKSFHVSMAALDCSTVKNDKDVQTVMLEEESNIPFILCNLQKPKILQSRLDLNFVSGDRVTFFCRGNGTVHLTGYIIPENDDEDEFASFAEEDDEVEEEEEEDDEEEEEEDDESKKVEGKGKAKVNGLSTKRKGIEASVDLPKNKKKKINENEEESDDDSEEQDELDDEEEDDSVEDVEDDEAESADESDEDAEEEKVEIKKPAQPSSPSQGKKDKKNKQQQNLKQQQQGKQKQQNNAQQQNAQQKKKPQQAANEKSESETSPKKVVEGGVQIKDIKLGNGPPCKAGRMATVYYTGRLKSNNKMFDQSQNGPGFKFRVGRGEVIKGWDVGLVGMKVGGKRLITCPPNMAYGQKGSPPQIPANSTLVFEVELKSVN